MAKIKTTNKYIKQVWKHVYRCGYCDLQYIMRGDEPMYYNCGIYGWNYDVYQRLGQALDTEILAVHAVVVFIKGQVGTKKYFHINYSLWDAGCVLSLL